ncbi:MAG: DUF6599 family protein [bacterium]
MVEKLISLIFSRCGLLGPIHILILWIAATPFAWGQSPMAAAQVVEATWTQEVESVLPLSDGVPGWQGDGDMEIYIPEDLYEYIDGAAEAYLNYGFRKLAMCRYIQNENADNEITVDVYDMGDPLQGFGIYASERSPEDGFIDLGGQGHVSETFLGFWQSKFYIKMIFFGTSENPKGLLVDFAKRISDLIEGDPPAPEFFDLFPKRNRISNTEQVFPKVPLGHGFLAPAYQASYKGAERPAALLVSVAQNPSEAMERLEKYYEHLKKIKASDSAAEGYPEGCAQIQDRHLGKFVLGKTGRYLVFFLGDPKDGAKVMTDLWKNLNTVEETTP